MAENIITQALPPGATAIVSSLSAAGTLYTAVTRRRLHIVSLVITAAGSGAVAGICSITVTPENGTAGDPLRLSCAATGQESATIDPIDLPTVSNVTTSLWAFTGTATFSLVGWEETTEK